MNDAGWGLYESWSKQKDISPKFIADHLKISEMLEWSYILLRFNHWAVRTLMTCATSRPLYNQPAGTQWPLFDWTLLRSFILLIGRHSNVECPFGKIGRTRRTWDFEAKTWLRHAKITREKLEEIPIQTHRTTRTADSVHICRLEIGAFTNHS